MEFVENIGSVSSTTTKKTPPPILTTIVDTEIPSSAWITTEVAVSDFSGEINWGWYVGIGIAIAVLAILAIVWCHRNRNTARQICLASLYPLLWLLNCCLRFRAQNLPNGNTLEYIGIYGHIGR